MLAAWQHCTTNHLARTLVDPRIAVGSRIWSSSLLLVELVAKFEAHFELIADQLESATRARLTKLGLARRTFERFEARAFPMRRTWTAAGVPAFDVRAVVHSIARDDDR